MDGSWTGSPHAASSRRLPAHQDSETRGSTSLPQSHRGPVQEDQNPVEEDQNPVVEDQSPAQEDQGPTETLQNPAQADQSPVEKDQNPAQDDQNPVVEDQNLAQEDQSPVETHQSSAQEDQGPREILQNPAQADQSPVEKDLNPAQEDQGPVETLQNPAQADQSPVEKDQNPAQEDQNPVVEDQSPAQEDQNLAQEDQSSAQEDQNLAQEDQSPAEEDQNLGPGEALQNPVQEDQNPVQEDQSPVETHRSPALEDQGPAETHHSPAQEDQSPKEEDQNLAKNCPSPAGKHQKPAETQHSLKKHCSPAKTNRSPAKTQQTAEKPDHLGLDKHTNHEDLKEKPKPGDLLNKPDQHKKQEYKTNADQRQTDKPLTETDQLPSEKPTEIQKTKNPLRPDPLCTKKRVKKTDESQEEQTQEDLCPANQRTDNNPHSFLRDLTVFTSDQKESQHHKSESKDQQNHQNPPTEKLPSATPERHQDHQDPLQQAPPLRVKASNIPPTEESTPAPPVQAPPPPLEMFRDQVAPCPPVSSSGEPRLCGFLQKQGGPLRAWKQRWFTYEEKKNQLFYYRTPQDVTPLGRVELCSATFTYPLKAEKGTFHIKTPERTFILKAVTQELMLYWLQQLQVKRWQHRQTSICPDRTCPDRTNNNNPADDFLPALKSPLGLVGEEAANAPAPRLPLANMSLKHPFIEIQNSVHSLRKRSSQDWSQSVFHVDAPSSTPPPNAADAAAAAPGGPSEPLAPLPLAELSGQVTPTEGRESPSLFDRRGRKTKTRRSSSTTVPRRDHVSSDGTSRLQQDKQILQEEVKAQKELVWILHKALEASQLEKRTCAEFLAAAGEQDRLELLRHRERQAADLRGRLDAARTQVDAAGRSLAQRDAQLAELQDSVRMLTEKNNAKQEVIIKLSDHLTSCLADPRRSGPSSGAGPDSETFRQLQQEVENLKDDIEAYKNQNKFLNSEIYQLTNLWRTSSEQEKSLMVKCAYLEASNCQVESRYLGVLRQLQETRSLDPVQRGAVQKMIEDALKGELKSVLKLSVASDHDQYGFKIVPDYEVEDMKLLAKIQALEIRSHNLLHQEAGERPQLSRWAQYLASRSEDNLCPSLELKGLLRGGVPPEYRPRVWRWVVRARTRTIRERHPQRYQQLCEKSRTSPHPASRQIQLDLHRTLTTNQHFSSPTSPALQQLRRVLLAFSWQSPAIGYCQGLNRLAALALLVLQQEEDAFWCLVAVVEAIMPQDYYTQNLVASQADQRVLKDFLAEKLPRLASHFEDHGIDVSLITFNWFLVVFVESLPSDILLPLWDAFLYEGTKVIFRYALALFKYKEDDILKIQDSVEIYQYLRFFTKTVSDSRRLSSIAFSDMNPFPGRLLRNRRALHLERLQGELQELEEQQREFVTESAERKDKELDAMVSEDDEEL